MTAASTRQAVDYQSFLAARLAKPSTEGPTVHPGQLHPMLHDWQAQLVCWAAKTSRAAIWADTGLGKTVMQVEWARVTGGTSLIAAPLAVCRQTVCEAAKVDVTATYVRGPEQVTGPGIYVTNYEMVGRFDPAEIDSFVLDEASILKQSDGKTRTALIEWASVVPHRLSCTATPAPNDPEELTSQAEFLGRMRRVDMLAAYFVHDDQGWRLKGHATGPMMRWMATWAVALRKPSDVGGSDAGYDLPGVEVISHLLPVNDTPPDQLFATDLGGIGGRAKVRRDTLRARCEQAASLIDAEPDEPWLVWAGLNDEADLIAKLTGAVNVHGTLTPEQKADALLGFSDGTHARIVTKPSIASLGLNWQHCARMVFVGLSDSYEQYYQAIRRCYRYGQPRIVHAHVVLSELESQIAANIARKERDAAAVTDALVNQMRRNVS
jgi:hypothetical protein